MVSDRQFLKAVFIVDVPENGIYARSDVGQDFAFRDIFHGYCFLVFCVSSVQLRIGAHEQRHGNLEFENCLHVVFVHFVHFPGSDLLINILHGR